MNLQGRSVPSRSLVCGEVVIGIIIIYLIWGYGDSDAKLPSSISKRKHQRPYITLP